MHSVFTLGKRNSLEVSEGVQVLGRQGGIEPAAMAWLQMCLLLFGMNCRWMESKAAHACLDLDWYRSRASAPSPYNVSRLIGMGARTSSGRPRLQGTVTDQLSICRAQSQARRTSNAMVFLLMFVCPLMQLSTRSERAALVCMAELTLADL